MRRSTVAASFAVIATLSSGRASAAVTNFHYHKWVPSGQKGLLGTSGELDLNCDVVQDRPPTILNPPEHGKLFFSRGTDFPKFNIDNPHYKCSFKKAHLTRVYYQSARGFIGTDRFTFEERALDGDLNISTFDITVQ